MDDFVVAAAYFCQGVHIANDRQDGIWYVVIGLTSRTRIKICVCSISYDFRTSNYESHRDRNPEPVNGTCQWLLQHPNYVKWRDSHLSNLLWVSADPGCGKSVLARFLADDELKPTESRITCYFFFKDDHED
jgi:hypothetical protein